MVITQTFTTSVILSVGLLLALDASPKHVIAGGVDEHTTALWLFDESAYPNVILTDAGRHQYDLRLVDGFAKWWTTTQGVGTPAEQPLHRQHGFGLVEGKFGGGLRLPAGQGGAVQWPDNLQRYGTTALFDRGNEVPERLNLGYLDWSLEFYFRAAGDQSRPAQVFELRNETGRPRVVPMANALMLDAERKQFILLSSVLLEGTRHDYRLELPIPSDARKLNDGRWHHLAFTFTAAERQIRHYVDGRRQAVPEKGGFLPLMGQLVSLSFGHHLNAVLDEMRVSDIVRYREPFDPPASFSRTGGPKPLQENEPDGPPLLFSRDRHADDAVPLGSRKHLFIDEALIDEMQNVRFAVNPPAAYEITGFRNDKPWEPTARMGSTIPDVCSVWDEGKEIRMLYTNSGMWSGKPHAVCLATSTDGLNWNKPELGLKNWGGSTRNNIVLRDACQGSVIKDPNPRAAAAARYKYAAWCMYWGFYVFTSPDGVHWRRNETVALPFDPDGSISLYWDDQQGLYGGFIRAMFDRDVRRRVARVTIPAILRPWPFNAVDRPDLGDMVLARPISGELPLVDTGGQVYRFKAHKYRWAPDTYLAFPWRFIADENVRPGSFLMVSRDGQHWKRYEDPYYFPSGWELGGRKVLEALMEHGMIRRRDRIWQYGTVRFTEHGGILYGGVEHEGGAHDRLLQLVQRLDGFVALEASRDTGTVITKPIVFDGERLRLNVAAKGTVRVALLDETVTPIAGFTIDKCDPIKTDGVRETVTWQGNPDVSRLAGKVVRLKFELQNAKLFALQFAGRE